MVKKPYLPGPKGKRKKRNISEYGHELKEKQKLKNWYNLRERQFKNYVKEVLGKRGQVEDAGALLMKKFAARLDNVIFRLGFADSRAKARQFVTHNHFLVNGKKINIPSFQARKGDLISLASNSQKKVAFRNITAILKKYKPPSWLELNVEKLEGKIISEPTLEEIAPPAEISSIFEYYSR